MGRKLNPESGETDHTFTVHDTGTGKYIAIAIPPAIMADLLRGWCIDAPESLQIALAGNVPV